MSTILGLSGSLRKGSYNSALLRAAAKVTPAGTTIELATMAGIPLYDGDLEEASGVPAAAKTLKDAIASAGGLMIATPEYNHSIPGVLKNAVDWATRPPSDIARVWHGKPVAILGATPGRAGTRLAQVAWLPVLRALGTRLFTGKQLFVDDASKAFGPDGALVDDRVRKLLTEFVAGFAEFVDGGR
jgi:chromate reductase, NAD(P)H dehydrogenase (quinone)